MTTDPTRCPHGHLLLGRATSGHTCPAQTAYIDQAKAKARDLQKKRP